jgi:catechol 2,3-dioxygenase-like lactoylglutathione lyase family enzyme
MNTPPDLAHLGPVEMFTPKPQESLDFFERIMGMDVVAREGQSVYLRGWDDYQRWSLKLTESQSSGIGYLGLRAWNEETLERRAALIEATGLGDGWEDAGDLGLGRSYRFRDPDGHRFKLYSETERYDPPEHLRPAHKNVHGKYTGRGIAIKRLDHINILAADVKANREFCVDTLGYRLYERIERNDGSEAGAWMSLSIAAHELIYTSTVLTAVCTMWPSGSTPARSACAPPTSGWRTASTLRRRRPSTPSPRGSSCTGMSPGGIGLRSPPAVASSTRRMSRAWSGMRRTAPRARPGVSRPWRPSTPTARRRSTGHSRTEPEAGPPEALWSCPVQRDRARTRPVKGPVRRWWWSRSG